MIVTLLHFLQSLGYRLQSLTSRTLYYLIRQLLGKQPTAIPVLSYTGTPSSLINGDVPPFPKEDLPVAKLACIKLSDLRANDPEATKEIFEACKNPGAFYLDLRGEEEGELLLKDADGVFHLFADFFAQDRTEKLKYAMDRKTANGYKPPGMTKFHNGTPDRNEFFTVGRTDIDHETSTPLPPIVVASKPLLRSFAWRSHSVVLTMLNQLDISLHLPVGTLASKHAQDKISNSQTRIVKVDPQPVEDRRATFTPHTDLGSMTVLFNCLGGLQVLPEGMENEEENWLYVEPKPGCAIVNVGDTIVKMVNGLFKSPVHRVRYPPGKQAHMTRYSVAYFSRPERTTLMNSLRSDVIPPLKEGEEDEDLTVLEWTRKQVAWKQQQHKF